MNPPAAITPSPDSVTLRRKGVLLMAAAALCWSLGGILVRKIALPDPWEIVFWRSLFMTLFVAGVLVVRHGTSAVAQVRAVGRGGLVSGLMFATMFFCYILSLSRTTVANSMALSAIAPFCVAIFGWLFLSERIPLRTWLAILAAVTGVVLMFADGMDSGQLAGNLLALGVPLAFTVNVYVLRRMHARVDMIPAVMIAGILSALIALPLAWPLTPTLHDLPFFITLGFVQLGLGCVLMTRATRYLSSGEIGLYSLLENVAAPIWVWIGVNEQPQDLALVGGLIVISALAVNEWLGLRAARAASPPLRGSK
jgi:drug/metabolite transporter (DMT)-like permease